MDFYQAGGAAVARLIWNQPSADPLQPALDAAKKADVVVAVVGITSELEGEEMSVNVPGFLGGDRTSLDLPKEEEELLKSLHASGKPLVVVLMNGSALAVNWAAQNANAILEAWYPGEEGGAAVAETLAGANNPAGRLPVTFYRGVDQLPAFEDYDMANRTYRYFKGDALFAFGYGLSYSKFEYRKLKLSQATLAAGSALEVDAEVRNTSRVNGDEVAELYLEFPPTPGAPLRALRGFTRVNIAAGKTARVHFKLDPRDLSLVNEAGDRVIVPGKYRVTVGGSQSEPGAAAVSAEFTTTGESKLPE
jgi:beta-glucosidase